MQGVRVREREREEERERKSEREEERERGRQSDTGMEREAAKWASQHSLRTHQFDGKLESDTSLLDC